MDIISAVEAVRLHKKEIIASIDMSTALPEIAAIRKRKERCWNKYDAIHERIESFHLISGVYHSTGAVQNNGSYKTRQELLDESADLIKAIRDDIDLLHDALELVEDAVEEIPDYDTRELIKNKYIYGHSAEDIDKLFDESSPGYARRLEQNYFRSLKDKADKESV